MEKAADRSLFWLISLPNKPGTFEANAKKTEGQCQNYKFPIATDLRVGTLDTLMALSDDLQKIDTFVEGTVRKIGKAFYDLVEKAEPMVKQATPEHYLSHFMWDEAKYPTRGAIKELTSQISSEVSRLDEELRVRLTEYNQLNQSIQAAERKNQGSLLVRSLNEIIKKEHWLDTEHLTTLFVVVPKFSIKEWETCYERLTDNVVPRSSRTIDSDNDNELVSVTLFKKVVDDFKNLAREKRFIVRDFIYQEQTSTGASDRKKLEESRDEMQRKLILWCKVNYGEAFIAWIHLKAVRLFVESVLRYGLPVNFQAILMKLTKRSNDRKLRDTLGSLYANLGGAGGAKDKEEGEEDFYPYVFLQIDLAAK